MDTSKEYIKMCEKVDLDWRGLIGNLCSIDGKTINLITYAYWHQDMSCNYWEGKLSVDNNNEIIPADEVIPIYRQDQLQEMIEGESDILAVRLTNWMLDNQKFYKGGRYKKLYPTNSMEQLWLAFVMSEKYNKIWNGEDWVKENK